MADQMGSILKDMDLISDKEIAEISKIQNERPGSKFGEIAIELGYITEVDLMYALAAQTGMPVAELSDDVTIASEIIDRVPKTMAEQYRIIPVEYEDGTLVVALADP